MSDSEIMDRLRPVVDFVVDTRKIGRMDALRILFDVLSDEFGRIKFYGASLQEKRKILGCRNVRDAAKRLKVSSFRLQRVENGKLADPDLEMRANQMYDAIYEARKK